MNREELIQICKDSVVHHTLWRDRDSYSAQVNIQSIYEGLTAGLNFSIDEEKSNENIIIIDFLQPIDKEKLRNGKYLQIHERDEYFSDCDPNYETEMFDGYGIDFNSTYTSSYMPTRKRLNDRMGDDWY